LADLGRSWQILAARAEEEFEYDDQDVELRSGEEDEDQMVIEPPEVRKAPYSIMNPGQNP
jgi:hypothetical protein